MWAQYIAKRGTLNVGLRLEAMLAQVLQKLCLGFRITKAGNVPFTMMDFYPHGQSDSPIADVGEMEDEDEDEEEGIKFGAAVRALKAITKGQ